MYGLVIEGVRFMIQENWGPQVLEQVAKLTLLSEKSISTHDQYSEHVVPQMFKAINEITGTSYEEIGMLSGRFFVQFLIRNGYGDLMNVMGRRFSDFIKGLDNIHEYFRFSYPKIRAPSFYCKSETDDGLILHYRSRRTGYLSYVIGQLVELARVFYNLDIGVQVLKKREKGRFSFVVLKLIFDNVGLAQDLRLKERVKSLNEYLPVETTSFLQMFPFHIVFNKKLEILLVGQGLANLMPDIRGLAMTDVFDLQRPCIKFTAEGLIVHQNCVFQVESLHPIVKQTQENITVQINDITEDQVSLEKKNVEENDDEPSPYVVLRGPMVFLKSTDIFLFLATSVVDTLDAMFKMGMYLNDFGESDCNKEIIMATIQKSDTLKTMLENEKRRSEVLTEMTKEISDAKKKARSLLSQMMPYEVAKRMMRGGSVEHCESYECVSIAFIRVCDFNKIALYVEAFEVVNLLNTIYSLIDEIVETHGVYKVETIGESYMIAAGCPYRDECDAEMIADSCLDVLENMKKFEGSKNEPVKKVLVKCGIFSGPVVGGVVGVRTPRYCLFGDTVNTASRMESANSTPMTIQCGQRTKDRIDKQTSGAFRIKPRGNVSVKGKGDMRVYEIEKRKGRPRYKKHEPLRKKMNKEEKKEEELFDEDNEGHRSSALSRMSLGESVDSNGSRRGSETSLSQTELNKSIAHSIEVTSRASAALDLNMQNENNQPVWSASHSKEHLSRKQKTTDSKITLSSRLSSSDLMTTRTEMKDSDVDETPRPTKDELEEMRRIKEIAKSEEAAEAAAVQPKSFGEDNLSEAISLIDDGVSFSEAPSDSIPVEDQKYFPSATQTPQAPSEVSTLAESEVKGKQSSARKVSASSDSSIEERLSSTRTDNYRRNSEKDKKNSSKATSVASSSLKSHGHSHTSTGKKDPRCKCEDIRADARLKTKVCIIM